MELSDDERRKARNRKKRQSDKARHKRRHERNNAQFIQDPRNAQQYERALQILTETQMFAETRRIAVAVVETWPTSAPRGGLSRTSMAKNMVLERWHSDPEFRGVTTKHNLRHGLNQGARALVEAGNEIYEPEVQQG